MQLYNTLSRRKEDFTPLHPPHVGVYVCGPTVYGDPHLGHARSAITFDLLFRYLQKKNYKVRYVRNITDVGHLENDADTGEDKIAKKARLEQLEPMEVAQYYARRYHSAMNALGTLSPSIEPTASGHIMEQIEIVEKIIDAGYAYVSDGSVYFDVEKYNRSHNYGKLSGRTLEDMISNTRNLDGQQEKRCPYDFALWKKASPQHIMQWHSPWSDGFPGWHLECSAMSVKYLGKKFDIHGGGMDLQFPHHECEIAQNTAAFGSDSAQIWMHNNMITIDKQKMGKSLGNAITLEELFTGAHPLLAQAYNPMSVRFFILQAHYRSTLDFSNDALQAADKGLHRLLEAMKILDKMYAMNTKSTQSSVSTQVHADGGASDVDLTNVTNITDIISGCYAALDDDLNSPVAIAHLFDAVRLINAANDGKESPLSPAAVEKLWTLFNDVVVDVLGLTATSDTANAGATSTQSLLDGVMNMLLELRLQAKADKNYALSDNIRNRLSALGINVKDGKEGSSWSAGR
jgi:cysteinyl-tRNA synthetase